jgi:SAM-dependent methyltransferase
MLARSQEASRMNQPIQTPPRYIHALRFRWLNRLYDPLLRLTKEDRLKGLLVEQLAPGARRILDVGCGTATLTILLKQRHPQAEVVGLDGDADILALARRKIAGAGVAVELRQGMAWDAPFAPQSFDRIVSSLVFHHLTTEDKRRTLRALRELLVPGGELHVADWGKAQNPLMRAAFLAVQLLDGFETTRDNVRGRLPVLMEEAGFSEVEETHREMTPLGTLSLVRAVRPR